MQGILLVDKPIDWTSFDVVNYVRRIVAAVEGKKPKNCKVGHTGTLDPFATGLLILMVGKEYTRKASDFSKMDKSYEAVMRLGQTSTTGDPEGEILEVSSAVPTVDEIETAISRFRGKIQQIPPAYSAIKIDGQRAYKLAREGKEVVIEPRSVIVNSLEIVDYQYPFLKIRAAVSSGTYIRTLATDIGAALKTGAYTTELRRTTVGKYDVSKSIKVEAINDTSIVDALVQLNP